MSSSALTSSSICSSVSSLFSSSSVFPSQMPHQSFAIKLTGSKTYLSWKLQFQPLLNVFGLHDMLSPTHPSPSPMIEVADSAPVSNPAYLPWFQKDQMLFSWILSSISEDCYQHLTGAKTSAEAWAALATAYGTVSNAQRTQLILELHNLSKDDKPVSEYPQQAKALANSLALAGNPLSDADFNAIVFRKLGSDFNGIIGALQQRLEPVPFSELHGQLVSYEILLNSQLTPSPSAHLARSGSYGPTDDSSQRGRGSYSNGGAYINGRGRGRGRNQGRRGYQTSRSCQICGMTNHIASTCRRRFDQHYNAGSGRSASDSVSRYSHDPMNSAQGHFSAVQDMAPAPASWLPDSGASHHITPDLASLHMPSPYRGPDHQQDSAPRNE